MTMFERQQKFDANEKRVAQPELSHSPVTCLSEIQFYCRVEIEADASMFALDDYHFIMYVASFFSFGKISLSDTIYCPNCGTPHTTYVKSGLLSPSISIS